MGPLLPDSGRQLARVLHRSQTKFPLLQARERRPLETLPRQTFCEKEKKGDGKGFDKKSREKVSKIQEKFSEKYQM